ncbi:MAG: hypothetical protein M9964_05430 [Solirubrobacterales bacterium]|nr:hypothetical protein [Solirubrobacterales bacterium]
MRARLTYANVMATVAVFIALGGGAYAAAKINGNSIKKNSIPSNRLKRNQAVPLAENVESLHVSSLSKGGHKDKAELASGSSGGSLVQIPDGQTATILESPPFTVTASCQYSRSNENDGTKWYRVTETATSSEGGWSSSFNPTEQPADTPVRLFSIEIPDISLGGDALQSGYSSPWLAVPSKGIAVTISSPTIIAHDGVCMFNQYAIG